MAAEEEPATAPNCFVDTCVAEVAGEADVAA